MIYIDNIYEKKLKDTVVILGNFDGIHKGHQILVQEAKKIAKRDNLKTAMFTFWPHPTHVIGKKEVKMITSPPERQALARKFGIDYYIQFHFDKQTAAIEGIDFLKEIIVEKLGAKAIVVGVDYRFGHKGSGNVELLKKYSKEYDYKVYALNKLEYENEVISSSKIRELLSTGEIESANEYLGHQYMLIGEVVHGAGLGNTIGFPTANIMPGNDRYLLKNGVYLTKTVVDDKIYSSMTNIGTKPTIDKKSKDVIVETYISEFNKDIYGKVITVYFYKFLREETAFNSLDELIEQLNKDKKMLDTSKNV